MKTRNAITALAAMLWTAAFVFADVKLPTVFADGMVLQQKSTVTVWGWAEPGEKVTVKGSWQWFGKARTTADADGQWRIRLKTPKAGGPHTLTIQGNNQVVLNDVLTGEVWICSGQSNMQWTLENSQEGQAAVNAANHPQIRLFTVPHNVAAQPQADCDGTWQVCTPETVKNFSAVAYYFGRQLNQKLNVPIGLIHTSWGGTVAEAWMSEGALRAFGGFDEPLNRLQTPDQHDDKFPHQNVPSALYNKMVYPLRHYRIAGAIWYQGESNAARWQQYLTLFPALIADWRAQWGQGDFPFYYVQIAPYKYHDSKAIGSATLREAQMLTLKTVNNVGMAVTMDIGEESDIHPRNKHDVGHRLALWALAKTYGQKGLVYSGPIYNGMKVERDTIRLSFDSVGGGLVERGGPLTHFEIAGDDGVFVPAKAVIDNNTVVVSAAGVPKPAAVRYAFTNWAQPNLFNKEGLPASSFRTDDWPIE